MLEEECRAAGATIQSNVRVNHVARTDEFVVRTGDDEFRSPVLVVATGGLSIPKIGATPFGYDLARQFGLKIREPRAALVPFVFNPEDRQSYCDLAGVSAEVVASLGEQKFREKMLITHRGLSGPAILQISSYWKPGDAIQIDLAPESSLMLPFQDPKTPRTTATLKAALQRALPNRLAIRWLELHAPRGWTNAALQEFDRDLHAWNVVPSGTEGFEKAEVTAGGVDTDELSPKSMESRKVPGLFFIGEVVDVTGHLGGFNFQWAWASGAAAGRAV